MTNDTALPVSADELNRFISKAWLKRFAFAKQAYRIAVELRSLRTRSATRAVRVVKPIEWGKTSYGSPEAITVVGVYRINSATNGGWSVAIKDGVLRDADGRTNFATVETAKAAAQADYERRVLSALIEPAAKAEGDGNKPS